MAKRPTPTEAPPIPSAADLDLSCAVEGTLPEKLEPQKATLTTSIPAGTGWVVETKFDGYRMLARVDEAGKVWLHTAGGHDWTRKLKSLATAVEDLRLTSAWLDGEIVVLKDGLPNFNALQNAVGQVRNEDIVFFVFDLLFWNGKDLRKVPLATRRALLERLVGESSHRVRLSEHFDAPPGEVFRAACELGLEGLMLKRGDSLSVPGRTQTWLKLKCKLRQEFVVCGFTNRSAASAEVGSLLLGYHEDGKLRYAGSVGTGWDAKTGRALKAHLLPLVIPSPPFEGVLKSNRWSRRQATEHWVTPTLVAEVEFAEWTPGGHVRHASFKGMRTDKPASSITRERSTVPTPGPRTSSVKVTNPDRVVDTSTGLTKLELVHYYERVADWMLPHLRDRPISLLRAPEGLSGELFFHKHPESRVPGLTEHDPTLWHGHAALMTVDSPEALVSAAQMNVIEFHTWNSTVQHIDAPDRIIFDLDPGEGLSWAHLQEAALLVQTLLTELGLLAWLKTSGGKGWHVVVPLSPRWRYEVVKGFSKAFAQHLARTIPQRFVSQPGASRRRGKVFVDYLRNGFSQTTAAAYTARARPGLGVSMPVAWEQLMCLKSADQWTVVTALDHLRLQQEDPWKHYWACTQSLDSPMRKLGYTPSSLREWKLKIGN